VAWSVDRREPASGSAPGQAVVVYDGSRVVGSATIASTRRTGTTLAESTSAGRA
jgi:tRNA-specific 2-thiouridylase